MPAPYAINDFVQAIPAVLQDDMHKLYPAPEDDSKTLADVLTPFVVRAINRYSKDRPQTIVSDIHSNATKDLPLPTNDAAVFDPKSSVVQQLEYPINMQPPQTIDTSDYTLYKLPTGFVIRLFATTIPNGDVVRATWTARHPVDGSTVAEGDFYAVVDLAASFAAEQLATIFVQIGDPVFNADVVDYKSKSAQYQGIAKMLRRRYYNHMGVDESADGAAEVKPALAVGDQWLDMQSGVGRLIHNKYTR